MSNKPNVLVTSEFHEPILARLEEHFNVFRYWQLRDKNLLNEVVGITTSSKFKFPKELYDLPKLKIISCFGVGFDSIDLHVTSEKGIIVTNTPDVLSSAVAEHAFGLLLGITKRINEGDRFVRKGSWPGGDIPLGLDLKGKRCGIVGMGRIGQEIAKLSVAFGMKVSYYGRHQKPKLDYKYVSDLSTLARESDFLIVALPANKETFHLIDQSILSALGKSGILINISRGSLIDEKALIKSLIHKEIHSAGLDVFEDEPNAPEELFNLNNVILTPHIGSATIETREAMAKLVVDNLKAYFETGVPLTPV